jgi:F-type H+-transporting ATPase subunit b
MTLFELAILAAEEEPEGIDLVLPEMKELYAGIIAFGIVFSFIRFFAWPRMIEPALERRQEAIVGQLREAENVKSEAESLLADYQAQVAGVKDEANQIIDEARTTADSMKAEIVARAEAEAAAVLAKAHADISAERSRAAAALQGDVANLSLDMAEKVVVGSIDRETQAALVERYLDELGGLSK